jgi:catechol 2,3-dioxygenase-like lactoylglutathione lyase family enzyme
VSEIPARINLVTLGVADVEASAAFYERLGWHRSSGSVAGAVAFFDLNGVVLGLFGAADLAADAHVTGPPAADAGFRGQSLAINLPSEPEVDAALAAAVAAGATLLKPAERADWGGWSGYFADPDGHAWEVAYNSGFPLDGAGRVLLPE